MHNSPVYEVVDSPAGFNRTAAALAAGRGPFAVDTERASAYRYDDRAFLVQIHRRGSGTFLIAPEGQREVVGEVFSPVVNGQDWIIHAAGEDLAALSLLGLRPARVFDTELAARLAGFDRPNLGAMVEHFTGVKLEKGHGREDWSTAPLPQDWLEYAALDVIYLNDLAEALAEVLDAAEMLPAAEQEFAHLLRARGQVPPKTWRDLKGLSSVRTPAGLQLARELWLERDRRARDADTPPSSVLQSRVIVDIARHRPASPGELARLKGFPARRRGATAQWYSHIERALEQPRNTWPRPAARDEFTPPTKLNWERNYPQSWEALTQARSLIAGAAGNLGLRPEDLLAPAVLRREVWASCLEAEPHAPAGAAWPVATPGTHTTAARLRELGARPWQVEIVAPLVASATGRP